MPTPAPPAPAASSPWRALLWSSALLALLSLGIVVLASRNGERSMLQAALAGFAVAGTRHVRAVRALREARSLQAAQLMLLTQLASQDDAALERMARSSGPAGEAARELLRGRRAERRGEG